MAKGSFDDEINSAMQPGGELQASKSPNKGHRPPPMSKRAHDGGSVPEEPPSQHKFEDNTGDMHPEQHGLQQAAGVPSPHMDGPTPMHGTGPGSPHHTIVNVLMQKDKKWGNPP